MVKSFSDFISMAFCKIFSNIAAAVATIIEAKVVTIHMAMKPAGSSSLLWNIVIYNPANTIKTLNILAQYFILFKAATECDENTLFCPIYPSNLNALYRAMKKGIDAAYPYKMNGSE